MNLAKDKYGRIGRQIHGPSDVAEVTPVQVADRRGNVYASTHSIEADQAYYSQKRKQANALLRAEKLARLAREKAELIEFQNNQKKARHAQSQAAVDPLNEKLKAYFAKQMGSPQHERVLRSVTNGNVVQRPADFSSSGGDPEIVRSPDGRRPIEWRADFRQHQVVGNVLTRDGAFGPAVTDYDRYVNGIDVNERNVVNVSGGTIHGRITGEQPNAMGFFNWGSSADDFEDFEDDGGGSWWDSVTGFFEDVGDKTVDELSDKLPEQIAKEIQDIISGGGEAHVNAQGQVVVTRPPTYAPSMASSMGIPSWALYTGLGLVGVGVLLVAIKTMKS